jgi:hypothetical protein
MEITTTPEAEMTKQDLISKAQELESNADNLRSALLAPSMAERSMREDAQALREQAEKL